MIWASEFWKDDLLKHAKLLKRSKSKTRLSELALARLEQRLMLGVYSIRKLIEAHKISDSIVQKQISLVTYPWSGKDVTFMNWHKIDEHYDLNSPGNESHDLPFLCNLMIHSYVFMPLFEEGKVSILVTSDRHRHRCLFELGLERIAQLFEQIGKNYPHRMSATRNPKTHDFDVVRE